MSVFRPKEKLEKQSDTRIMNYAETTETAFGVPLETTMSQFHETKKQHDRVKTLQFLAVDQNK